MYKVSQTRRIESFPVSIKHITGTDYTFLNLKCFIHLSYMRRSRDNVTLRFYNLDLTDRHTFTIGALYNINKDLLPGKNATFTFKASDEGIFKFYCIYHQPTMAGQLIVLPPPPVEKTTATTK
jgi:Cupredoxin-like domain